MYLSHLSIYSIYLLHLSTYSLYLSHLSFYFIYLSHLSIYSIYLLHLSIHSIYLSHLSIYSTYFSHHSIYSIHLSLSFSICTFIVLSPAASLPLRRSKNSIARLGDWNRFVCLDSVCLLFFCFLWGYVVIYFPVMKLVFFSAWVISRLFFQFLK